MRQKITPPPNESSFLIPYPNWFFHNEKKKTEKKSLKISAICIESKKKE